MFAMVEENIGWRSKQFLGHVVHALHIIGHERVDLEPTFFELFARAVLNHIFGLIQSAQICAERVVLLATIPRIHEGEYHLLHLKVGTGINFFTFTLGWDDAMAGRVIAMRHLVDAHG